MSRENEIPQHVQEKLGPQDARLAIGGQIINFERRSRPLSTSEGIVVDNRIKIAHTGGVQENGKPNIERYVPFDVFASGKVAHGVLPEEHIVGSVMMGDSDLGILPGDDADRAKYLHETGLQIRQVNGDTVVSRYSQEALQTIAQETSSHLSH